MSVKEVTRHVSVVWDGLNTKLSGVKPALLLISSVAGTILFIRLQRLVRRSEKSICSR